MKLFLLIVLVFICIGSTAQGKAIFSSQNYIGLLEGESGTEFQVQTINGIKYRTWFIGLGTGIDGYYLRSIPAFLSLNKDFLKSANRNFFIAVSGGVNFPWEKDNHHNGWGYTAEKLLTGIYWEGGAGYKIGIGKGKDALLMLIGYSYKHLGEKLTNVYITTPELDPAERFDYRLRRLSLKMGWNF